MIIAGYIVLYLVIGVLLCITVRTLSSLEIICPKDLADDEEFLILTTLFWAIAIPLALVIFLVNSTGSFICGSSDFLVKKVNQRRQLNKKREIVVQELIDYINDSDPNSPAYDPLKNIIKKMDSYLVEGAIDSKTMEPIPLPVTRYTGSYDPNYKFVPPPKPRLPEN